MLGEPELPRVEDVGAPAPERARRVLNRDIDLLLDTIDELHSRISALDPHGLTTDEPGGW